MELKRINRITSRILAIFRPKIFCISFQRTGTTSVGVFFMEHGYSVANYGTSRKNDWTFSWFKGDFNKIFNSFDFKTNQVFEDDPWWCLSFYKFLFHRFPKAKFILLERDPDKWFESMINHSKAKTLGNTYRHSKIFRRELEYYDSKFGVDKLFSEEVDNLLPLTEEYREHYKKIYLLRIREIKEFFNQFDSNRLFYTTLENPNKWYEMGNFFKFNVAKKYDIHLNKSLIENDKRN